MDLLVLRAACRRWAITRRVVKPATQIPWRAGRELRRQLPTISGLYALPLTAGDAGWLVRRRASANSTVA